MTYWEATQQTALIGVLRSVSSHRLGRSRRINWVRCKMTSAQVRFWHVQQRHTGKYYDRVSNIEYEAMKDVGTGAGRGARIPDTIVEMLRS